METQLLGAVYMGNGTGEYTRWSKYNQFLGKVMLYLCEAGTFFILSQQGGIPLETDGIPAKAERK